MTPFQGVSFRRPRWVSGVPDDSERAVAREVSLVSWESEFHATQKSVEGLKPSSGKTNQKQKRRKREKGREERDRRSLQSLSLAVAAACRYCRERKEQKRQPSSLLCRRRRYRCSLSSTPLGVVAPLTVR
ncbi:hypothetical protein LWI28_017809 [Acer negundo]|uniref:Uncharacterized protein n=1 Tax=Acer negundo TaxID=4023 RepID=A0AAD5INK3_ACENE|nr:hypothetical protein LWI28_017809 [Acer negundo]